MFSEKNGMKLEIDKRKRAGKSSKLVNLQLDIGAAYS